MAAPLSLENAEAPPEQSPNIRASIGFPPNIYRILEDIARRKKVSLAWVVREAAEKYVADELPLFLRRQ